MVNYGGYSPGMPYGNGGGRPLFQPPAFPQPSRQPAPDPIDVFVVDDFVPEADRFNHGQTVSNIVRAQGAQVHNVNIDRPGQSRALAIADALDRIAQLAVINPRAVDAVNLSQTAGFSDGETRLVQQKVQNLINLGVPVVIAAGNNGPGSPNQLATNSAIVVQSADANGNPLPNSGPGNFRAFAPDGLTGQPRQTSFAAPEVATLAGQLRAQGFSMPGIRQALAQIQAQRGGVLGGAVPVFNVFF